jgi:hypothetical protein
VAAAVAEIASIAVLHGGKNLEYSIKTADLKNFLNHRLESSENHLAVLPFGVSATTRQLR